MQPNKYIFFRNDQHQVEYEVDPQKPDCLDKAEFKYFGRVLNLLEPQIQNMGLTVYITAWTVHELPSYGKNVISCILQDEWGREPKYRDKVGMVFKTCGTFPYNFESYCHGGFQDSISNFLGQSKAFLKDGDGRLRTVCAGVKGRPLAPVHKIPLGYYAREDVTYIPISERENDLYFAGSIQHKNEQKLKRPKELARNRMTDALLALNKTNPEINIKTKVTEGFGDSISTDNQSYLQNMMNTKICPIPRGANLETFRFYEAIKSGCIPIGEAFPKAWYYDDAPIIRLKNWADIKTVVPEILNDTDRLNELHQQVLKWWEDICSEKPLADHLATKIKDFYKP